MKMSVTIDPGSEEEDSAVLYRVENGKMGSIYTAEYNEIRMLRLFNLLCSGKDYIGEKILIKHLSISENKAKEVIAGLVIKNKLKRKFFQNIWSISRGDKLLD